MPSKSKKQHNLMAMVANDKAAAKRLGIPQSVGREFMKADKMKKSMKCGGKVHKMKSGGKVRGCGMAKQGTRKAKMY